MGGDGRDVKVGVLDGADERMVSVMRYAGCARHQTNTVGIMGSSNLSSRCSIHVAWWPTGHIVRTHTPYCVACVRNVVDAHPRDFCIAHELHTHTNTLYIHTHSLTYRQTRARTEWDRLVVANCGDAGLDISMIGRAGNHSQIPHAQYHQANAFNRAARADRPSM